MRPMDSRRGFSRLEMLIAIIVIGLFIRVLLDRLHYYQELAEKAAMEQTVAQVQSGLNLQVANLIIQGRTAEIPALAENNPMDWLPVKQANYIGAFANPAPGQFAPGSWYYDRKRRELVYLVNQGDHFSAPPDGRKQVRYRVVPRHGGMENGVRLEPVVPVMWFKGK